MVVLQNLFLNIGTCLYLLHIAVVDFFMRKYPILEIKYLRVMDIMKGKIITRNKRMVMILYNY